MEINDMKAAGSQAADLLQQLRHTEWQQDAWAFRQRLRLLGVLAAYELSRLLPQKERSVPTPLGTDVSTVPDAQLVIVGVMRAALPFLQGFEEVFPAAPVGFIGSFRKEGQGAVQVERGYEALPDVAGKHALVVDPMLATGGSAIDALNLLEQRGTGPIDLVSVIAAPEGVAALHEQYPDRHRLSYWALDEHLNEKSYIVPGLGDAGDLSFGTKGPADL